MPPYKQYTCHKQLGSTDGGVFAIAYAVDVSLGNEAEKNRYEHSKMREHLVNCFELGKLTPSPKCRTEDKIVSPTSDNKPNNPDNSWSTLLRGIIFDNETSNSNMQETYPSLIFILHR